MEPSRHRARRHRGVTRMRWRASTARSRSRRSSPRRNSTAAARLLDLRRYQAAASAFGAARATAPDHPFVRGQWLHAKMLACDWERSEYARGRGRSTTSAQGDRSAEPFGFQAIATSPADLKRCAQIYAQARFPAAPAVWRGERYDHRADSHRLRFRRVPPAGDVDAHGRALRAARPRPLRALRVRQRVGR